MSGDGQLECTKPFASTFGAPALGRIAISIRSTLCKPIVITTASKKAAVDHADGIGSHYTFEPGSEENGDYVPKSKLKAVGAATAKNGDALVLHRFVGIGDCDIGGRMGASQLKPFMRFYGHDGRVYDNWDNRPFAPFGPDANYRYTWSSYTIDRSAELLR